MHGSALRVVSYSRVSTTHHDQKPEIQAQELRRYCTARNWALTEEIVDHGYSGSTDVRPGLKRLMDLARTRSVDAIVVVKLDRLFRSLKHLVTSLEEFQALGIQFIAVKDNVDYTTPSGRLFVQVMGSLAEFEKSLLRERTMMGLAYAKASGKRLGRPKTRKDDMIQALRTQGYSMRQIAGTLKVSLGSVQRSLTSKGTTN